MIDLQFAIIALFLMVFVILSNITCFWLGAKSQHLSGPPVEVMPEPMDLGYGEESLIPEAEEEADAWRTE